MPSYIGKYRGIVVDNKDPEYRGRLKCKCPQVFGEEVLNWALPCLPYGGDSGTGFFSIPKKDSSVWLEFEQGDADLPPIVVPPAKLEIWRPPFLQGGA